jgi:hypothetical protein
MAARAFSGYVDDKLRESSRLNDYLAYATTNDFYVDPIWGPTYPYPDGEERKRINAAFGNLFKVVNETGAIRKAIENVEKIRNELSIAKCDLEKKDKVEELKWNLAVNESILRKTIQEESDSTVEIEEQKPEEVKEEILELPEEIYKRETKKSFVFARGRLWIKTA